FFYRNVFAGAAGEHFCHEEGLGQKALDFTGAGDHQLIFFRELVHAENGNDVLQLFVALQYRLNTAGNVVVLVTDNQRVEQTGRGVQWIYRRVNTQLGNGARQYQGCIQVSKGGGWRGVGQVIRRNVYGLEGGDGTGFGGGDALLENAHLFRQCWLVAHRRWHTTQQCRYFGTGQSITINV